MPISSGDNEQMLNDDVDDIGIIDEVDEAGVGPTEHRSTMELNDEDVLTENDIYPSSNGRLASVSSGPSMQPHYLLRAQSTLDEEDDSSVPLNSTNSNPGYNSNIITTGHHRQPYYRSEAVIEMGGGGGGVSGDSLGSNNTQMRQGVAIMR